MMGVSINGIELGSTELSLTTTATAAGTTALTVTSARYQQWTGTTTQTVTLPVVTTLTLGWSYTAVNDSTGNVTINSSGGNAVYVLVAGQRATIRCVLLTGTTAASWTVELMPSQPASQLIGTYANFTDFPNAKMVVSKDDTGFARTLTIGVVSEAIGVGVFGVGQTTGSANGYGLAGAAKVSNTSDTGSAIGLSATSQDTHVGGNNIGLFVTASGGALNFALYMAAGNIYSEAAQSWLLADNTTSALSFDATGKTGILAVKTLNGTEGVTMSGTLEVTGTVSSVGSYNSTTASAANVFINATTGLIQRSTSAAKYKTDIQDVLDSYADIVYKLRPVLYKSLCDGDNSDWSWYGFIADEVAALEPRLVHWGYAEKTVTEVDSDGIETSKTVIDTESPMIVEGFQYERLTVLLTNIIQRQHKSIIDLEDRIKKLESLSKA